MLVRESHMHQRRKWKRWI